MEIVRSLQVPTGHILITKGKTGRLTECLSLGDYGKERNVKADFLGLSRSLDRVEHCELLSLEKKWVVTVSTQHGCTMGCNFCDVPRVGSGINVSLEDLLGQVDAAMSIHLEIRNGERLNLHYARMGEPTWNRNVLEATRRLRELLKNRFSAFHPVVSTMMPRRNKDLSFFIASWLEIKNDLQNGDAGLQLSINSTDEFERKKMFNGNAMALADIAAMLHDIKIVGRKITLNFAVADYTIDAVQLREYFDPRNFMVKLTPMHKTAACIRTGTVTHGDYTTLAPYEEHEHALKSVGFDVLVFVASHEEDAGRITCGNAILSGTTPNVDFIEEVVGNRYASNETNQI